MPKRATRDMNKQKVSSQPVVPDTLVPSPPVPSTQQHPNANPLNQQMFFPQRTHTRPISGMNQRPMMNPSGNPVLQQQYYPQLSPHNVHQISSMGNVPPMYPKMGAPVSASMNRHAIPQQSYMIPNQQVYLPSAGSYNYNHPGSSNLVYFTPTMRFIPPTMPPMATQSAPPQRRERKLVRIQDPTTERDVTEELVGSKSSQSTQSMLGQASAREMPPSNLGFMIASLENIPKVMKILLRELQHLFKSKPNNEAVFDWIDTHVTDRKRCQPDFVRILMTAVIESTLSVTESSIHLIGSDLLLRCSILEKYINHKVEFELEALYAIQALIHKLGNPQTVLCQIFHAMYHEDVISKRAFSMWRMSKDPAEQEGKHVASNSVQSFFAWIKEMETDSVDEVKIHKSEIPWIPFHKLPKGQNSETQKMVDEVVLPPGPVHVQTNRESGLPVEDLILREEQRKVAEKNEESNKVSREFERNEHSATPVIESAVIKSSILEYQYKEDQWSPLNPEGKRQYDRAFLLQMQKLPMSMKMPERLPDLEIIKDSARSVRNPFSSFSANNKMPMESQPRGISVMARSIPDFTPGYVKSRGRGTKDTNNIQLGFASSTSSFWARGSSGGSRTNSQEPCISANRFQALATGMSFHDSRRCVMRTSTFGLVDFSRGHRTQIPPTAQQSMKNSIKSRKNRNWTLVQSQKERQSEQSIAAVKKTPAVAIIETHFKGRPDISEDELDTKTKSIIDEYLHNNNLNDTTYYIRELCSHSTVPSFITFSLNGILERSSQARHQVGQLMNFLVKEKVISLDQYLEGLRGILGYCQEYAIDIPKLWEYLAELIVPVIQSGILSLVLLRESAQPCFEAGLAGELFAHVLLHQAKSMGTQEVGDMWRASGLSWSNILQQSQDQAKFIRDNKLEFTIASREAVVPLPVEKIKIELQRLLKSKPTNEAVFDWIDTHVIAEQRCQSAFVRALMTAVIEGALTTTRSSISLRESELRQWCTILQKYLDHKVEFELQALFAIQALMHKLKHPKSILCSIFHVIHDEDVISKDALHQWEVSEDPAEQEGKGVAVNSVRTFFTWLKEMENDSAAVAIIETHFKGRPNISEDELDTKTKSIIYEYLHNNNLNDTTYYIRELCSHSTVSSFITFSLNCILERSSQTRHVVGQLMNFLVKEEVISLDQYLEGLRGILGYCQEYAIDIPKLWEYLAELIVPIIQSGILSLVLLRESAQPCFEAGLAGELFAHVLHHQANSMGTQEVGDMWRASGLSWSNILQQSQDQAKFIRDNKLEFTIASREAVVPLPVEKIKAQLQRLFKSKPTNKAVFDWIDTHVIAEQRCQSAFVRALMTAVIEGALTTTGSSISLRESELRQWCTILQKYLDHKEEFELQALFAIQALMHKLAHPKSVLCSIFHVIHDEDVISKDALHQWEVSEDPAEQEGKGVAVNSVRTFFTWLEEMENDSGDES